MRMYELHEERTTTIIFEAQESDSLIGWSEEDSKFLELKETFPEIKEVGWHHVLPVPKLKVIVRYEDNLDKIFEYIKQNIIKGE